MFLEWKLMFIRRKQQKKLTPYNKTVFKNIMKYLKRSSLATLEMEEVFHQVLDMLLQAQAENKNINLFLGQNHQAFCDAIISEYDNARSKTLKVLNYIELYLVTLLSMQFTFAILEKSPLTFNLVTLVSYSLVFIAPIFQNSNREKTYPENKPKSSGCGTFLIFFFIYMIFILILDIILKRYGFDIFETRISLYSARYLLALAAAIIIGTEVYKALSRRRRTN